MKVLNKNIKQCLFEIQVEVSVYYESLCPDSKKFITTELKETYDKIGHNLDVRFRPFGKAAVSSTR